VASRSAWVRAWEQVLDKVVDRAVEVVLGIPHYVGDVVLGPAVSGTPHGAKNPGGSPGPVGEMSPKGLPGLDSGLYRSASACGEKVVVCSCGVRRLVDIARCPGCGVKLARLEA